MAQRPAAAIALWLLGACFSEPDGNGSGDSDVTTGASSETSSSLATTLDSSTTAVPVCVHRIFVTGSTYVTSVPESDASFTNRAEASELCTLEAARHGGQWLALIASDEALVGDADICGEVRTLTQDGSPGELVAADEASFWSENHAGAIGRNNEGELVAPGISVWTGFTTDGGAQSNCWNNPAASNASVGDPTAVGVEWANASLLPCSPEEQAALYCLEVFD